MIHRLAIYIGVLTFLVCGHSILAQKISIMESMMDSSSLKTDTFSVRYFSLDNPDNMQTFDDTLLTEGTHHYNPVFKSSGEYLFLGNTGSPVKALPYTKKLFVGYHHGHFQYDLYNFDIKNVIFYDGKVPFSDISFTPVKGQKDFVINGKFSRKFSDGFSMTVNYRRIRDEGLYTHQKSGITNVAFSLGWRSKNKKYQGFATHISNVSERNNNGGIKTDTLFGTPLYNDRSLIPVFTSDATTRYQQKKYILTSIYRPKPHAPLGISFRHDFYYDRSYFKFADETTGTAMDSSLYGAYLIEERGIRYYDRQSIIHNNINIDLQRKKSSISVGIGYDRISLDRQSIKEHIDNLYLTFRGRLPITSSLDINADGRLGIGDGIGDFWADGHIYFSAGPIFKAFAGISLFRHSPTALQKKMVINGKVLFKNDFTHPFGSMLYGRLTSEKLGLSIETKQTLTNNEIYWDSLGYARQYDGIISITSLSVKHRFRVGKLGMSNKAILQLISDNVYHLPTLITRHNVYIQTPLFKGAILSRFGVEAFVMPFSKGTKFHPVLGTFIPTGHKTGYLPRLDLYFSGKIKSFRFFVKGENILNFFNDRVDQLVYRHPLTDAKIRYGIRWIFYN